MTSKFRVHFWVLMAFFSFFLSCARDNPSSARNAVPQHRYGGVLRIAAQSPESLDPIQSKSSWESEIVLQLFDGLLRFDENLNIAPALAEDWKISSDGKIYTFHLRKGVRFHNGREATAEDFVYSLTRLLDPGWNSADAAYYLKISGAEDYRAGKTSTVYGLKALDPLTLQITLAETYSPFLRVLAQQPASVVPKEEVERKKGNFGKTPVGTGAYRFQEWNSSGEIVLIANPDYFEGRPYLEGVRIKTFSALNARDNFRDFLDGKLDISFVPSDQLQMVQSKKEWVYVSRPVLRFMYLGMNLQDPLMSDIHIRKAIHFGINKLELMKGEPDYLAMNNLIPFSLLGSNPANSQDTYHIEVARRALKSSRFYKNRPLRISLWHAGHSQERQQLLARLVESLKPVGIEVNLRIVPSLSELLQKIYSGQTQLFLIGEVIDFPDPDALLNRLFHSKSKGNPFAYRNAEVDQLLREAQRTLNEDLRAELYGQIETKILEDHVIVPLFLTKHSFVTHQSVQGIEMNPLGFQYLPLRKVWMRPSS